ncbi:MAG: hypothetical protein V2B18_23735 [Pseudomonadota bacterium]
MAEFSVYERGVEVLGEVIAAFIAGFPEGTEKMGSAVLEKHGIRNPRPGEWYPLQSFLEAMKEIADLFGGYILTRIGERIAFNAVLPPGLNSLDQCLKSIDVAYHMNHRGGEIGHYRYSQEGVQGGLNRALMVCPNCYPCFFDLGVIEGFSRRFKPEGAVGVVVRHDDSRPCRRKGDNECTYIISWV